MAEIDSIQRPASVVSQSSAFLSFFGFVTVLVSYRWIGGKDAVTCWILLVVAVALPHLWLATSATHQNIETHGRALERNLVKLAGLAAIYALVALAYYSFQGFSESFVKPLWPIFDRIWLPLLLVSPFYIWLTDRRMEDPHDGLYQVGLVVTGAIRQAQYAQAQQYLLGWCVKGFFIPLMVTFSLNDIKWFLSADILAELRPKSGYYFFCYKFLFFVDVVFGATGYLCALRLLGTHIRSTEPTMSGWVVCVMCYPPFWAMVSGKFLDYEEGYYWNDWLAGQPVMLLIWSGLILSFLSVYVWVTMSYGVRFSNLTNRGILTNGFYRWLKHPHYVAKNISWWLVSIPFLTNQSPDVAVRGCLLLLCVNAIYLLRAKTEERHLMQDPAYVAYSNWMKSNSLWAHSLRFTCGLCRA